MQYQATGPKLKAARHEHSYTLPILLILLVVSTVGCAKVNYLGEEFTPTSNVDIYYSEDAIEREYDLIGHGLGHGTLVKNKKIQEKLIDEAKKKGADAILVTGLGKSSVLTPSGFSTDEKQVNVVFLRYR